jgi:hypothetical protein
MGKMSDQIINEQDGKISREHLSKCAGCPACESDDEKEVDLDLVDEHIDDLILGISPII